MLSSTSKFNTLEALDSDAEGSVGGITSAAHLANRIGVGGWWVSYTSGRQFPEDFCVCFCGHGIEI